MRLEVDERSLRVDRDGHRGAAHGEGAPAARCPSGFGGSIGGVRLDLGDVIMGAIAVQRADHCKIAIDVVEAGYAVCKQQEGEDKQTSLHPPAQGSLWR